MAPTPVAMPNYGLYADRPPISVPRRAVLDGYNFRIRNGVLSNLNLGWALFYEEGVNLGSRIQAIVNFFPRSLEEHLMFFTETDIVVHNASSELPEYLTPQYDTGTAAATGDDVTGVGTLWLTNAKAGDFIHFGDANFVTVDADEWHEIESVTNDTALVLVDPIPALDDPIAAGAYTIRQTFTGSDDDFWSVVTFVQDEDSGDDLVIATNGVDDIVSWNGDDATVTMHPELMFTAKALAVFANMVIYINVDSGAVSYPTSIINSDIGKPLAAGAVGTGVSEQFRVSDKPEVLLSGVVLGNNLVLYSKRQLIVTQFAGDPLIFIFRVAASGVGPIAPNAIADFGDYHEFYAADGQYGFDGVGLREINAHIAREVIRTADPLRRPFIYSHFDEENGDLIWSVPGTTDPDAGVLTTPAVTAWSEHYLETVPQGVETPYSKRAWPFTATGYYTRQDGLTWAEAEGLWEEYNYSWNDQFSALSFPQSIAGDVNGVVYIVNETQTANGEGLPSYVRFGRVPLVDGHERALLARIYPFTGELDNTLEITTYLADFATSSALDGGTLEYDTSHVEGEYFVSPYRRARFVEIQFGNSEGVAWTLEGYDMKVKSGGKR